MGFFYGFDKPLKHKCKVFFKEVFDDKPQIEFELECIEKSSKYINYYNCGKKFSEFMKFYNGDDEYYIYRNMECHWCKQNVSFIWSKYQHMSYGEYIMIKKLEKIDNSIEKLGIYITTNIHDLFTSYIEEFGNKFDV